VEKIWGDDLTLVAVYPDGEKETFIVKVNNYYTARYPGKALSKAVEFFTDRPISLISFQGPVEIYNNEGKIAFLWDFRSLNFEAPSVQTAENPKKFAEEIDRASYHSEIVLGFKSPKGFTYTEFYNALLLRGAKVLLPHPGVLKTNLRASEISESE